MSEKLHFSKEVRIDFKSYFNIPFAVLSAPWKLKPPAALVFGYIMNVARLSEKNRDFYEQDKLFIQVSRENICSKTGLSMSTVKRSVDELIDKGMIEERRIGQGKNNRIYPIAFCDEIRSSGSGESSIQGSSDTGVLEASDDRNLTPENGSQGSAETGTLYKEREEATKAIKPTRKESFSPPDAEEVRAYCIEIGYDLDPELFISYYSSNGWMVGKNPMTDWKAAVRVWKSRENKTSPGEAPGTENPGDVKIWEDIENEC